MKSPARIFILILLVSGFLFRVWAVGNARFTGDESYFWATARNTATFEAGPVYGPALTGSGAYHPGPLFYYLMAFSQLFGVSPWIGGIFVALLHVLSSFLAYRLASRIGGERAGILVLILLLFAPWDVLYADRIWLSCVAPVFGTLALYSATRRDSFGWQIMLAFSVLVLPQFHMSAPIVWAAILILILCLPPAPWKPKALLIGLFLAVCAYGPPIVRELSTEFGNTRAILREGGGKEPWDIVVQTPLKVFGYILFYTSSEIGYHFNAGYWRPFDDLRHYASAEGWRGWLDFHGAWAWAGIVSLLLAAIAWISAIGAFFRAFKRAVQQKSRRALGFEGSFALAMLVALIAATALMMLSKKPYFPHYTNLLMPLILVLPAAALDRLFTTKLKPVVALALGISVLSMASNTIRYYLTVDRLNGMSATLSMVDRVMDGPMPVELRFDGFNNSFAWEMLANVKYRRPIKLHNGVVRWRVYNRQPFQGAELPPNSSLHGAVLLERSNK